MNEDDTAKVITDILDRVTNTNKREEIDSLISSLGDEIRITQTNNTTVETDEEGFEFESTQFTVDEKGFEQVLDFLYETQDDSNVTTRRQAMIITGKLIDELMTESTAGVSYDGNLAVNELVPVLSAGLSDHDERVRQTAATQLNLIARTRESPLGHKVTTQTAVYLVVDELRYTLNNEDVAEIRASIAEALSRLATERPSAVESAIPELCEATGASEDDIRNSALAALVHTLKSERFDVAGPIAPYRFSLDSVDKAMLLDTLVELLGHPDSRTRERAASAISNAAYHFPAYLDPIMPDIEDALQTIKNGVEEMLIESIAYIARAHPLLALPALPELQGEADNAYAQGVFQHIRNEYPSMISEAEQTDDGSEISSEAAEELLLNQEPDEPSVKRFLANIQHDSQDSHSRLIEAICTQLLDFETPRAAVFACEILAISAVNDIQITERSCEALFDLAAEHESVETAPRAALEVIKEHQPPVVDSVSHSEGVDSGIINADDEN